MARRGRLRAGLLLLALAGAAGRAEACGYHAPVDIERGLLNLVYPEAMHVSTAVWQAEQAQLLRAGGSREADIACGCLVLLPPPRGPFAFHATARQLERFGRLLADATPESEGTVSLVLIDSMLWTRFVLAGGTVRSEVHSSGPGTDGPVLVSHTSVIEALVDGRLSGDLALERGLLRVYRAEGASGPPGGLLARLQAGR